jgi:hypothetical protein
MMRCLVSPSAVMRACPRRKGTGWGVLVGRAVLELIEKHVGVGLPHGGPHSGLVFNDCQGQRKEVVEADRAVLYAGGGHGVVGVERVNAGQHDTVAVDYAFGEGVEGVAVQACARSGPQRSLTRRARLRAASTLNEMASIGLG